MMEDKTITVTCPKCGIKITNTVSWFKKPGSCCPGCQLRLSTERFRRAIEAAEQEPEPSAAAQHSPPVPRNNR